MALFASVHLSICINLARAPKYILVLRGHGVNVRILVWSKCEYKTSMYVA